MIGTRLNVLVHVNVIANLQKRCTSLRDRYQRKTLLVVDVSVIWPTNRNWQTKVLDTWKVTQLDLPVSKVLLKHTAEERQTQQNTRARGVNHRNVYLAAVVEASASRAKDPSFESRLRRDFSGVESHQRLKNWQSSGCPARRLVLQGQRWDWSVRCQYTVTG